MIENQSEKPGGMAAEPSSSSTKTDATDAERVLLTLNEAAGRLSITPRQMLRLARIQDVAHVEIDEKLYFRPEALTEWVARNEHKAWA